MLYSLRNEVIEAARDYRYLLNRGFPQKASLDFISANYNLTTVERNLLFRCVHRATDSELVKRKAIHSVRDLELVIDGYNVILTITSAIEGLPLFLCDDGFIRDLRSTYIRDFETPTVVEAIHYVARAISTLDTKDSLVILDKNVSWSAKHAELIRRDYGVNVTMAAKADIAVIGSGKVVSSSDFLILLRSEKVYDLAQFIIKNFLPGAEIVELHHLL
ncbi:MAG: DUF434 domain-containing protein [Sulfolobales archaeon]